MEETAGFLARFSPFDQLRKDDLLRIAAAVTTRSYLAGADILIEDGTPSNELYVVRSGSVEVLHQDEVIDILEPGECFGHPSLLTGMAPAFTVRAHEPTTCLLLEREPALEVLGRPAGASFVARTLRERLVRAGHTVHGLPEVRTLRIGDLVTGPPVFCAPELSVRQAAALMSQHNVSALLVSATDGLGIVTDTDFRHKVVAAGVPAETPVSHIMSRPVLSARSDRFAVDASLDMLHAGVHHLAVTGPQNEVLGIVSAADLMDLANRSPFALRRAILHAPTDDALHAATQQLPQLFTALLAAGLEAPDIGRVLALSSDAVTTRLLDFAIARHGPAPCAWAWLALGSVARRELTLASDQDNALAYADTDDPAVDSYFERVAQEVNAGLARAGFGADISGVVAGNSRWRMSQSGWVRTFRECLESPDRSHLVRAAVSFDFRHVVGGLEIVPPLVAVLREARGYPGFVAQLARTATDVRPALGHGLLPGRWAREELDLKKGGIVPIANLARFHALSNGITISATLDRLVAAEELEALPAETAQSLREAFTIVCQVRLEHHAACIRLRRPPDNLIRPDQLAPLARTELREALRAVVRAQKLLGRFVPLGLN